MSDEELKGRAAPVRMSRVRKDMANDVFTEPEVSRDPWVHASLLELVALCTVLAFFIAATVTQFLN